MEILKRTEFITSFLENKPHRLVFMGDYVDRGKAHLSTLARLLLLKMLFPDRIFLLRGNHDGGVITGPNQVKLPYRKPDEEPDEDYFPTYLIKLGAAHPETESLLPAYLNFFETLGQVAFIQSDQKLTMAVHGGIPRPMPEGGRYFGYLKTLGELSNPALVDAFGRTMVQNLMWSDPYIGTGDLREGLGRYYFTEEQFTDFIQTIGVDQLIRGHEAMAEGYRVQFENRIYTIFSSGKWPRSQSNELTAYDWVRGRWARLNLLGEVEIYPKTTVKPFKIQVNEKEI